MKIRSITVAVLCATAIAADDYTDRLMRITKNIANELDPANLSYVIADNVLAASLQTLNFVKTENALSKNSPLGKQNKYIDMCADKIQKTIVQLVNAILQIDASKNKKMSEQEKNQLVAELASIVEDLNLIKKDDMPLISKKQFLPFTSVQRDLINLLDLLIAKNRNIAAYMMKFVRWLSGEKINIGNK